VLVVFVWKESHEGRLKKLILAIYIGKQRKNRAKTVRGTAKTKGAAKEKKK
jgi:hypothetical protein